MTTLVAVQGDGWAVLGCDSRSSDESGRPIKMMTHKIVENNGIFIAGAGAGRGSNIMQFGWKAPKPLVNVDLDIWVTRTFIPEMRKAFVDAGYDMKEDGGAAEHDSVFLISVKGIIYPIFEDYSWDRDYNGIYYCGSGGDIALGALQAMGIQRLKNPNSVEIAVRKAIAIAADWDIYTAEPIITKVQYSK
jgi:ATP-dependent protease HslVU (ClpYQ) peptidase subunit|tara:strand:+ start:37 stop:606 length:570 start_codon:yes stop_codon:yes gene_type:complete